MRSLIEKMPIRRKFVLPVLVVLILIGSSVILALISTNLRRADSWWAFLILLLMGAGLTAGVWKLLRVDGPPRWLLVLTVAAALLRLGTGIFWQEALPRWGHGSPSERAGYVMGDAHARDTLAWRLAHFPKPLTSAFVENRKADQYGGMLFISAFIYRYMGGPRHQPLLVLLPAAVISALAVLFTWGFARRAWGAAEAGLAAWILALYPEAVLLGSSQMREAFTITLASAAVYGLLRGQNARPGPRLAWIVIPLAICMPFSPPVAAMILVVVVLLSLTLLFSAGGAAPNPRLMWAGLAALGLVVLAGLYLALKQFAPIGMINPIAMVGWWFTKSAQFQAYMSEHASGWMQKVFKAYPVWIELPALLGYGVVQPFLPAALVARSEAPIWYGIAIWRAVGWTVLLAFMVYAPLLALRTRNQRSLTLMISLIIWVVILVASARAGGDMWDNPRYRTTFAGLQAALAAWAWMEHRRVRDPLFRRAVMTVGAVLAWFLPWYLRRYTPLLWPVVDLLKTLGAGAATAFLLILWDWARSSPLPASSRVNAPVEPAPALDHG